MRVVAQNFTLAALLCSVQFVQFLLCFSTELALAYFSLLVLVDGVLSDMTLNCTTYCQLVLLVPSKWLQTVKRVLSG